MMVDTFGTGVVSDEHLTRAVLATFDARPGMLIQELDLRRPIFRKTAAYGHFGRELPEFTWEKTPHVAQLKDAAGMGKAVSAPSTIGSNGTKNSKPVKVPAVAVATKGSSKASTKAPSKAPMKAVVAAASNKKPVGKSPRARA